LGDHQTGAIRATREDARPGLADASRRRSKAENRKALPKARCFMVINKGSYYRGRWQSVGARFASTSAIPRVH
jgi:hypothetical protein